MRYCMKLKAFFRIHFPKSALLLAVLAVVIGMTGCGDSEQDVPLDDVQIDLKIVRLDEAMHACAQAFYQDSTLEPQTAFKRYFQESKGFVTDWMFGGNDSIATDSMIGEAMMAFVGDPHGRDLVDSIHKVLGGLDVKAMLEPPLKRYKYYFPTKEIPTVVAYADGYPRTAQAGLDQVFISPKFLGVGMHYFMGPHFQYYPEDLPKYIRRRCTPDHLPALVVHKIADLTVPEPDLGKNPVLIDYVIREGIRLEFVDKLLGPDVPDTLKIFYDATQMDWANLYEGRVYRDLVKDLYSADAVLQRRYVDDSPFTSQLNRASAPRLGQFIGWRIVKAYMRQHPDITIDKLVEMTDYQRIFKDSQYRPPKEG